MTSIYLSIYLSICLSVCLSVCLSIYTFKLQDFTTTSNVQARHLLFNIHTYVVGIKRTFEPKIKIMSLTLNSFQTHIAVIFLNRVAKVLHAASFHRMASVKLQKSSIKVALIILALSILKSYDSFV